VFVCVYDCVYGTHTYPYEQIQLILSLFLDFKKSSHLLYEVIRQKDIFILSKKKLGVENTTQMVLYDAVVSNRMNDVRKAIVMGAQLDYHYRHDGVCLCLCLLVSLSSDFVVSSCDSVSITRRCHWRSNLDSRNLFRFC